MNVAGGPCALLSIGARTTPGIRYDRPTGISRSIFERAPTEGALSSVRGETLPAEGSSNPLRALQLV